MGAPIKPWYECATHPRNAIDGFYQWLARVVTEKPRPFKEDLDFYMWRVEFYEDAKCGVYQRYGFSLPLENWDSVEEAQSEL